MKVALYARVSTNDQDPEPQLARLREWASSAGHDVRMERAEVASGRLVRRRLQEEILGEALGRRVDAVACVKVDRWARSLQHLSTSVGSLHARGASFYCVDQGLNVVKGDPTAGLTLGVLGAVAEWEAAIISERTKEGLVGKVGRGRHWKGCGSVEHPCPTGAHRQTNGIPVVPLAGGPFLGSLTNDRLIPQVAQSLRLPKPVEGRGGI